MGEFPLISTELAFDRARHPRQILFNYPRHFVLLGLLTAALAIAGPAGSAGIGGRFALYGALHAAALALSIPAGGACSPVRRVVFVAAAAVLAMATARLGLFGLHAVTVHGGTTGPFAILAACAALGALAYGALIRAVLANPRSPGGRSRMKPLIATSLGCAGAASVCLAMSRGLHSAGVVWLVVPWWFAFSGGLWYAGAGDARLSRPMPIRSQSR